MEWIEGYWENIEVATMNGEEDEYYAWKDKLVSLLQKYKDYAFLLWDVTPRI